MRQVAAGGKAAIQQRLCELDEEWDIERYLETMAPSITLLGLTLGITKDRRWLLLPIVVQSFFCSTPCRAGVRRFPCSATRHPHVSGNRTGAGAVLQHHLATLV